MWGSVCVCVSVCAWIEAVALYRKARALMRYNMFYEGKKDLQIQICARRIFLRIKSAESRNMCSSSRPKLSLASVTYIHVKQESYASDSISFPSKDKSSHFLGIRLSNWPLCMPFPVVSFLMSASVVNLSRLTPVPIPFSPLNRLNPPVPLTWDNICFCQADSPLHHHICYYVYTVPKYFTFSY